MFKVVITEKYTEMEGCTDELLAGLAIYIKALKENGVSEFFIKSAVEIGLNEAERNRRVNTIVDEDKKIEMQKIDLNGMSKEEAKSFLEKEIFNKLFD